MTSSTPLVSIARASRPDPKLCFDPLVMEALSGPLPAELVRSNLPHQPLLIAPVKLVLSCETEGGLLAEIPRITEISECERYAREAIEKALGWLEGDGEARSNGAPPEEESERLEEAIATLPWRAVRGEDGSHDVRVAEDGLQARVRIELADGHFVRISTASTVGIGSPHTEKAVTTFALEANRRVRLARLSLTHRGPGVGGVVWDVVLPARICGDAVLALAVNSVLGARLETAPAVRALGDPVVARTYLALRRPNGAPHPGTETV